MSNVNKVKLLSERTSGVPPVIFKYDGICSSEVQKYFVFFFINDTTNCNWFKSLTYLILVFANKVWSMPMMMTNRKSMSPLPRPAPLPSQIPTLCIYVPYCIIAMHCIALLHYVPYCIILHCIAFLIYVPFCIIAIHLMQCNSAVDIDWHNIELVLL